MGYIMADLILPRISISFSKNPASRSKITSRMPPISAARIMLTYSLEKACGCLAMASVSDRPPLTSLRVALMTAFIASSLVWLSKMSRHLMIGMPASIIVANCREKTTRVCSLIFCALLPAIRIFMPALASLTETMWNCCSWSFASTACSLSASTLFFTIRPDGSTASYTNVATALPPALPA